MKDKSMFIVVVSSIIIVFILLLIPNKTYKNEVTYQENLYKSFKLISSRANNSYELVQDKKLSNGIINIVYYNEGTDDYLAYLINSETGKIVSVDSLIKKNFTSDFYDVESSLLHEKYPSFIVDGVLNNDCERHIVVYDNKLVIFYKNVVTSPQYNDKIFLIINNNELSRILNYEFNLDAEYSNESGYQYDPTKKYVAFSFDDGPSANNTKDIVDYLTMNKAHATFFMLGKLMSNHTDIISYVLDNGSEIGSHTYSHKNLKKVSKTELRNEINNTSDTYTSITNQSLSLLRPPYGSMNKKNMADYNYSYILWSVDTNDWKYKDSDYLYDYVINNINDGDIILMHDIHDTTKVAVERILPELYVRGYRVVSVSELAKIKNVELIPGNTYRSFK